MAKHHNREYATNTVGEKTFLLVKCVYYSVCLNCAQLVPDDDVTDIRYKVSEMGYSIR